MKRITRRTIATRLTAFLLTLIVSSVLGFAHRLYVNRQWGFNMAAFEGDITRMRVLYAVGVKVNDAGCSSRNCFAPMIHAGWGGHPEAIQFLIDRGADVNKSNSFGMTALMFAAYSGNDEAIELLLRRGADVNVSDENGNTALSYAKQKRHRTTIALLLRAGAHDNSLMKN
jgi:hypothetical protein